MAQGQKDDDTALIIIVCAILLMAMLYVLQYFRAEINYGLTRFKYIETYLFSFWSADWKELSGELLARGRDLGDIPTVSIARFYNRYASFAWLFIYFPVMWFLYKKPSENDFKSHLNQQTLLERTARMFSPTYPYVGRDITKYDWNYGAWRLMETPLMFLIRNRAIKDPNGEPFRYNQCYECGDCPGLYTNTGDEKKEPDLFDSSSFDEAIALCEENLGTKAGEKEESAFKIAPRTVGTPEEELVKFKKSDLTPSLDSVYLNMHGKNVLNEIDEPRLYNALVQELGNVIGKIDRKTGKPDPNGIRDPFGWLKYEMEQDKKNAWRYGLAAALYLHGYSDNTKKDAYEIFDAMNYSLGGNGPLDPLAVNIGKAATLSLKFEDDRYFRDYVMKHCYFTNVFFMALFAYARRRGVVENCKFGWVRYFDRSLWYTLVQTGRAVPCAEGAGPWSHYFAEEAVGKPLDDPYMHIAIAGFREEMKQEGYLNENAENERDVRRKNEINAMRRDRESAKEYGY